MVKKLIIGAFVLLAVGMSIPSTRASIVDTLSPFADAIKWKIVPRRLEAMADQLAVRVQRGAGLPTGNQWAGWLRRDYTSKTTDPWGNTWYLQPERRGFSVGTMGPDGVRGTDDDMTVRREYGSR